MTVSYVFIKAYESANLQSPRLATPNLPCWPPQVSPTGHFSCCALLQWIFSSYNKSDILWFPHLLLNFLLSLSRTLGPSGPMAVRNGEVTHPSGVKCSTFSSTPWMRALNSGLPGRAFSLSWVDRQIALFTVYTNSRYLLSANICIEPLDKFRDGRNTIKRLCICVLVWDGIAMEWIWEGLVWKWCRIHRKLKWSPRKLAVCNHKSWLAISSQVEDPDKLYLLTIWTVAVKETHGRGQTTELQCHGWRQREQLYS